ncbi:unnamed protein product [Effrenium voratum]|nr:unnamed protein product [Effrenium voratum]
MLPDYYKALGLRSGAAPEQVKQAYRQLALKWHPDKNDGDANAAEKFKELAAAFEVLGDPVQRELYDEQREERPSERTLGDFIVFVEAKPKKPKKPKKENKPFQAEAKNVMKEPARQDVAKDEVLAAR